MYKFELLPIIRNYNVDFYKDVMDAVETKFAVSPDEDTSKYEIELYVYYRNEANADGCNSFHIRYLKDDFEDNEKTSEKVAVSRFLFMKNQVYKLVAYVIYEGNVIDSQVYEEESQNG